MNGRFLETLVDGISEALVSWTPAGEIATWNRAAERLLGYRSEEMLGRSIALLIPPGFLAEHDKVMTHVATRGTAAQIATTRRHANGDLLNLSLSLSRLTDGEGHLVGIGCLMRPLSETAQMIDRLRRRVHTDPLTGALNRAGVEELLACPERYRGGAHRAVLFIDLDGFKQVNDHAGHRQGDELLKRCAARIRANLPAGSAVARWGGDEFVVILEALATGEGAARRQVEQSCRAVIDALQPAYQLGTHRYRCPASIGACVYQPARTTGAEALEIADRAMYEVKAMGKNSFRIGTAGRDDTMQALRPPLALAAQG